MGSFVDTGLVESMHTVLVHLLTLDWWRVCTLYGCIGSFVDTGLVESMHTVWIHLLTLDWWRVCTLYGFICRILQSSVGLEQDTSFCKLHRQCHLSV